MAEITNEVALGLRSATLHWGRSGEKIQASHALDTCTRYMKMQYLRVNALPGSCKSSEPGIFVLDLNRCKQNKSVSPFLDPFLLTLCM